MASSLRKRPLSHPHVPVTISAAVHIAAILFSRARTMRLEWLFGIIDGLIVLGIQYSLWRTILPMSRPASASAQGISTDIMVTYGLLALTFGTLTRGHIARDVEDRLRKGEIVYDLIRPTGFPSMVISRALGFAFADLLLTIAPLIMAAFFIWNLAPPQSLEGALLAIICWFLGAIISYAIDFTIGVVGFKFLTTEHFEWLIHMLKAVLSGGIVPFWFLPQEIRYLAGVFPFHMLGYTPIALYLGRIDMHEASRLLLSGTIWTIILVLIAHYLWRRSIRQFTIQGG